MKRRKRVLDWGEGEPAPTPAPSAPKVSPPLTPADFWGELERMPPTQVSVDRSSGPDYTAVREARAFPSGRRAGAHLREQQDRVAIGMEPWRQSNEFVRSLLEQHEAGMHWTDRQFAAAMNVVQDIARRMEREERRQQRQRRPRNTRPVRGLTVEEALEEQRILSEALGLTPPDSLDDIF